MASFRYALHTWAFVEAGDIFSISYEFFILTDISLIKLYLQKRLTH